MSLTQSLYLCQQLLEVVVEPNMHGGMGFSLPEDVLQV